MAIDAVRARRRHVIVRHDGRRLGPLLAPRIGVVGQPLAMEGVLSFFLKLAFWACFTRARRDLSNNRTAFPLRAFCRLLRLAGRELFEGLRLEYCQSYAVN